LHDDDCTQAQALFVLAKTAEEAGRVESMVGVLDTKLTSVEKRASRGREDAESLMHRLGEQVGALEQRMLEATQAVQATQEAVAKLAQGKESVAAVSSSSSWAEDSEQGVSIALNV